MLQIIIHLVLIVPCGIEIVQPDCVSVHLAVLIVPCGIEIYIEEHNQAEREVLIVPCGIEIVEHLLNQHPHPCLNRTMWN